MSTNADLKDYKFDTEEGRAWLKGLLHDENVKDLCVVFTKKDGTERTMQCTLIESKIPELKKPKEAQSTPTSDAAIRVFDTIVNEWRSFRWDSIKEVKYSI